MFRRLYTSFIAPTQQSEDTRNRELVLNTLLAGTLLVLLASLPIFLYNYFLLGKTFAPGRMMWVLLVLALVGGLYGLARSGRYRLAAFLLVVVYFLLAASVIALWGVTTPTGILLLGVVIVLAGILLGSWYSLYAAAVVVAFLFLWHVATTQELAHPDLTWTVAKPEIGDVAAFTIMYGFLAVISWLFNYQMERSLRRAQRAEAALKRQKALLEKTVEKRTRQLQAEQLERIQQMYRFAELGQVSTALLHDLANHLTTITLDIEGLEAKQSSEVLRRTKRSIRYIDETVQRVRDQLHGKSQLQLFNVTQQIEEVVDILQHKAAEANVNLQWQPPTAGKSLRCRGEPVRFRQLIANVVSNAIEAYDKEAPAGHRDVIVQAEAKGSNIVITVRDWGKGVPSKERAKVFEPFYSTKKTGMGMGLFIARQIAEDHLTGRLVIDKTKPYTAFVMTLPRAKT